MLHVLGQGTKASWDGQVKLASPWFSPVRLYGLYKLSGNLEEPFRGYCRSRLASALKHRGRPEASTTSFYDSLGTPFVL